MERETKEAIGWLACILIIFIALISVRMYLTPEDTVVDTLPANPDWKELQLMVRKQFKLISFGLRRRYFNLVKNLMKTGIGLDLYLKKNYKGISEITVDHIDKESTKEILRASLLIRQGTEKVVAKIVMNLNEGSPIGYIVNEGTICNGSDCSD